jgi:hypothetical protein
MMTVPVKAMSLHDSWKWKLRLNDEGYSFLFFRFSDSIVSLPSFLVPFPGQSVLMPAKDIAARQAALKRPTPAINVLRQFEEEEKRAREDAQKEYKHQQHEKEQQPQAVPLKRASMRNLIKHDQEDKDEEKNHHETLANNNSDPIPKNNVNNSSSSSSIELGQLKTSSSSDLEETRKDQ